MKNQWMTLKQLDQQLSLVKALNVPSEGWVRTIRKVLGMTVKQLASRLGVNPSRVVKIETSELEGAITLRTMQQAAEQLHCHFAYQFIPQTSLDECVRNRAKELAEAAIKRTAHMMDLESQSVEKKWLEEQITEMTQSLLQKSWRHLWEK
ncbi:MAG: transcriptional regulator [Gammaproteobacteria bacterium CG_4_10_14_0_8_um_filter_38_16]|nr:MAG: transcriptional regulator [Gammaproteobacteria bacterium CG_4_10_14_0_8_um_filter_38_16]PJA03976.1 MAG: transcriptional regulator [Gammaproteobacteria bacterium CG_4_10_14_0_2_um_filter_38_22]PJB10554.1 MAG: transcriptional regulator [Gammaproteobacteria bacterium CG_4_9_14_3_um_filter_38_9]